MKIMKIVDKLEAVGYRGYSLEFFPPKTDKGIENLKNRVSSFYKMVENEKPLFIDLTWGAGGSTSELSLELAKYWNNVDGIDVNMHITCTNIPVEKLDMALSIAKEQGIKNLVALRGDPPNERASLNKDDSVLTCPPVFVLKDALELVRYIREKYEDNFCLAVAGYPEGHTDKIREITEVEVLDLSEGEKLRLSQCDDNRGKRYFVCRDEDYWNDLKYLKKKVDAGGDLILTQLFYDVKVFLQFVKDCRLLDIKCPIIPGIMLNQSINGFNRMVRMCRTKVSKETQDIMNKLSLLDESDGTHFFLEFSIRLTKVIVSELYENGINFFHLYTLNSEKVTKPVIEFINGLLRK